MSKFSDHLVRVFLSGTSLCPLTADLLNDFAVPVPADLLYVVIRGLMHFFKKHCYSQFTFSSVNIALKKEREGNSLSRAQNRVNCRFRYWYVFFLPQTALNDDVRALFILCVLRGAILFGVSKLRCGALFLLIERCIIHVAAAMRPPS